MSGINEAARISNGGKDGGETAGQVSLEMCVGAQMGKLSAWHFQVL